MTLKLLAQVRSWSFLSLIKNVELFGCEVAHAFFRMCSFDLMSFHIWA